jgi:hypothetical protein
MSVLKFLNIPEKGFRCMVGPVEKQVIENDAFIWIPGFQKREYGLDL